MRPLRAQSSARQRIRRTARTGTAAQGRREGRQRTTMHRIASLRAPYTVGPSAAEIDGRCPFDGGRRAHWHRRRLACTSCPCSSLRPGEFAGKDRTGRTTAPAQGHCARPTRKPPTGVDEPRDRRRPPARSTQLELRLPVRRFPQPGDDVGRLAIACFEEVRVHVQGRRRVGVAEATADRTNWNASG